MAPHKRRGVGPSKRAQRGLGRAIYNSRGPAFMARETRSENDRRAIVQVGQGFLNCEVGSLRVYAELFVILLFRYILHRSEVRDASIDKQYVNLSQFLSDDRKEFIDICKIGDIRPNGQRFAPEKLRRFVPCRFFLPPKTAPLPPPLRRRLCCP